MTMRADWWTDWLAIPARDGGRGRDGADCWGLAVMVYAAEAGIALPPYDGAYVSIEEAGEIAALIETGRQAGPWVQVEAPGRPLDLLVYRRGGYGAHVAIVVDGAWMLHMGPRQSEIRRRDDPHWRCRLTGIWRHGAIVARPCG